MGAIQQFQPRFILKEELLKFGLPTPDQQPDIVNLVERASTLIDEYCSRTDVNGNGSLVYTTYTERILIPVGRNIFRLSFRPLTAVSQGTVAALAASGSATDSDGNPMDNYFYTGVLPNQIFNSTAPQAGGLVPTTTLSPIISASGRYGYARRGQQQVYPDLNYAANVLQIASFFGGPPAWTAIDVGMIDYDPRTAELWVPAGLYLSQYSEVVCSYNSGFDPLNMPRNAKHACAALVRNLLSRGGGATGLKGFSAGRVQAQFTDDLFDPTIAAQLQSLVTVRAY